MFFSFMLRNAIKTRMKCKLPFLVSLLPGASNKNISEPPYLNSVTCLASVREGVCLMGSDDAVI